MTQDPQGHGENPRHPERSQNDPAPQQSQPEQGSVPQRPVPPDSPQPLNQDALSAHPEPGPVTPGWGADPGRMSNQTPDQPTGPHGQHGYGQGGYGQRGYDQQGDDQQRYRQQAYGEHAANPQGQYAQQPHSQQPRYQNPQYQEHAGQDYAHMQGHHPWTTGHHSGTSAQSGDRRRGLGVGAVVVVALLTSLLGGGIGAAGYAALSEDTGGASTGDGGAAGIEINNPESATAVTAAAAKASPSVVTLGVADGSSQGSGSGIILDDQGHVLTNTHVVTLGGAAADPTIQVRMNDGRVTTAQIVGTDPLSDLAVIQLADTDDLTPAELGTSGDLNVGDPAVAIGAPLGLSGTVTDGIISTLDRTIQVASAAVEEEGDAPQQQPEESEEEAPGEGFEFYFPNQPGPSQGAIYLNVIQTDAAINQGNSGGALVDGEGRIIGVNVAIASTGGGGPFATEQAGSIGVGFAIPIDYAQRIAQDLINDGEASHGLLGVSVAPASPDPEVNQRILAQDQGVAMGGFTAGGLVSEVTDGSPADEAGLEVGDVITHVEGRSIEDGTSLTATVREYAAGETISLTVIREGEEVSVDVTLSGL